MEWFSTRTTCATIEAAIVLPGRIEDQGVGVEVPGIRVTDTQKTPGSTGVVEAVVRMADVPEKNDATSYEGDRLDVR